LTTRQGTGDPGRNFLCPFQNIIRHDVLIDVAS
jgi:hypothetical protein